MEVEAVQQTNETFTELRSMMQETISVLSSPEDQQSLKTYVDALTNISERRKQTVNEKRSALQDIQSEIDRNLNTATSHMAIKDCQGNVEQLQERMMGMGKRHHKTEEECESLEAKISNLRKEIESLQDEMSQQPKIPKEEMPKEIYMLDLYQMISHIEWDLTAETNTIKGAVAQPNGQSKDFLLMTSQSPFFVANYLWDMV